MMINFKGDKMEIFYPNITVKKQLYIKSGCINISKNKIHMITGKNGVGKSLLLSYLHLKSEYNTVLLSQKNDEVIPSLTVIKNSNYSAQK